MYLMMFYIIYLVMLMLYKYIYDIYKSNPLIFFEIFLHFVFYFFPYAFALDFIIFYLCHVFMYFLCIL